MRYLWSRFCSGGRSSTRRHQGWRSPAAPFASLASQSRAIADRLCLLQLDERGESLLQRRYTRSPELPRRLGVELTEDGVRNSLERSRARREKDPGRTSISDVRAARDQTVALEQTRHGRH